MNEQIYPSIFLDFQNNEQGSPDCPEPLPSHPSALFSLKNPTLVPVFPPSSYDPSLQTQIWAFTTSALRPFPNVQCSLHSPYVIGVLEEMCLQYRTHICRWSQMQWKLICRAYNPEVKEAYGLRSCLSGRVLAWYTPGSGFNPHVLIKRKNKETTTKREFLYFNPNGICFPNVTIWRIAP